MEVNNVLEHSWERAWRGIGAQGDGFGVRNDLLNRYDEPNRAYHTTQHLLECVIAFSHVEKLCINPAAVELAIWFHDAVYDHHGKNEERSAILAVDCLVAAQVPSALVQVVQSLILITRHSEAPQTNDEKLLVDIDLAILGASEQRFSEYESQIKLEYSHLTKAQFLDGRKKILKSFMERQRIYSTDFFFSRLEKQARENLLKSISVLE